MSSLKQSSKRRSGKKESPTERSTEENKLEVQDVVPSPDAKRDLESGERWDDIGDEEETYLARTREELHELIMKLETFTLKVKEKDDTKLFKLIRSLLTYSRENVEDLQLLQPEKSRLSPSRRDEFARATALMTFQRRRICWMISEITSRLRKATKELAGKKKLIEELNGENSALRKSLEAIVGERDELLGRLDSLSAARKDASVSTEAEMLEVEMAADLALPSSGEVSQHTREILEAIVERKVGDILARTGFPVSGKPAGREGTKNRVVQPPKVVDTWSEVVKRRKQRPPVSGDVTPHTQREVQARRGLSPQVDGITGEKRESPEIRRGRRKKRKAWPAPPSTAAVVLSAPAGEEAACVELLRRAKEELPSIEEMGIPPLRVRRARMGGLILGVPGEHPQEGADRLAASLSGLASKLGVRVTRPIRKADIRVSGLEESTTEAEVAQAISRLTGCPKEGMRSGIIRRSPAGVGALWLQCPIEAATIAAKEGSVKVGWVHASIEMLGTRPPRCYKCLEVGHVATRCTSEVDRARRCYRCGSEGHTALSCGERVPRCPLCVDTGRPHDHVLGGAGCDNSIPPSRSSPGREGGMAAQDGRAASSSAG